MSDNKELLLCPFCGAEAKVKTRATRMVNCTQCSASTFEPHDDEFGALKEWNRRAAQPVVLSDEQKRQLVQCLHGGINMGWIEEEFALELGATILAFAAKEQA